LVDRPLARSTHFYVLGSIDAARPAQAIVAPDRHVVTPFELTPDEWSDMGAALGLVREHLAPFLPDGFTMGWNVGAVAGQDIFHAHLHVIARFAGEPSEGRGLHAALR
jgi:diadenosine tetraphosphate (Ap4A) HIT family hydrolase